MKTWIIARHQHVLSVFVLLVYLASITLSAEVPSSQMGHLNQTILLNLGGQQVSLPVGMKVNILNKGNTTTVVSFQFQGSAVITQISSRQLDFLVPAPRARMLPSTTSSPPSTTTVASPPPATVAPVSDDSNRITPPDQEDSDDDNFPDFRTTLSPDDVELPAERFTKLNGSFYIVIDAKPILVVYSIPMDGKHLAPSASNIVFYGPFPTENGHLVTNMYDQYIVTKLGCTLFTFAFIASHEDLSKPQTAYWSKESGWFKAVLDARDEIAKGFGLKKKKLLLFGVSGGGGMVLNLAGAFPDQVEAVVAQGANLAPDLTGPNAVKWCIVNNRGDTNASINEPFYERLKRLGCKALYCETTPSRGREKGHALSQECLDLMYTFIAGILDQRKRAESGQTSLAEQWPYAAPSEPLKRYKVVRSVSLDTDSLTSGHFDLLPSAPFALNWSKVCPPLQNVPADGADKLHVNFPASPHPNGLVIYYANPDVDEFPREYEDICALAEAGSLVISPTFKMPPEKFAKAASNWLVSQARLGHLPIHLAAYGEDGSRFLSAMSDMTQLSFKSVNLISLTDFTLDTGVKDKIESLAKESGLYSFFICRRASSSTNLINLAEDLVDNQSRARGCQAVIVNPDVDDKNSIYDTAVSTVEQAINNYNGNVTDTSPDLWIDQPSLPQQPLVVNQKMDITVYVHDRGIYGKKSTIELKSLGEVLATQDLSFDYDGYQQITLSYVPAEAGKVDAEIVLLPIPEEISKTNNQVEVKFTVGKCD